MQFLLQRPREQHVAGHADDDGLGGDVLERLAQRGRAFRDGAAIDRLAQQQERPDGEALREAPPMVLQILRHGRAFQAGAELAEPHVELVAPAVGEHPELTGAAHARRHVAVGDAVAHQFPLQVTRGRAPAIGAQPRRDADQPRAAGRMADGEGRPHHAPQAGADEGDGRRHIRSHPARTPPGPPGRAPTARAAPRGPRSRARSIRCRARRDTAP